MHTRGDLWEGSPREISPSLSITTRGMGCGEVITFPCCKRCLQLLVPPSQEEKFLQLRYIISNSLFSTGNLSYIFVSPIVQGYLQAAPTHVLTMDSHPYTIFTYTNNPGGKRSCGIGEVKSDGVNRNKEIKNISPTFIVSNDLSDLNHANSDSIRKFQ